MATPQTPAPVTQSPDGSLAATAAQILLKQGEMGAQLAVIQERLTIIPDHESRLRALERFRFTLMGGVLVISTLVSAVVTYAGLILARH